MKYDITKCNNLNFKLASGLSGFMKVSPKGDCYLYQHDGFWDADPTDLKPFDKVLIKRPGGQWGCAFFSDISLEPENEKVYCTGMIGYECIPYNDETKHLVATSDDCPDFYKWWEE